MGLSQDCTELCLDDVFTPYKERFVAETNPDTHEIFGKKPIRPEYTLLDWISKTEIQEALQSTSSKQLYGRME